jgi:hypothetical protein
VPNATRGDLEERVHAQLLGRQRCFGGGESRVRDFLHYFSEGEDERAVEEGQDDPGVVDV